MTTVYTVGGEFRVDEKYGDMIELWKDAVKAGDPVIKCTFQAHDMKIAVAHIVAMRDSA